MIEYLLSPVGAQRLDVECEFGMGPVALLRCGGPLNGATLGQLLSVVRSAREQEYRVLIFDFTYCSHEPQTTATLFAELAEWGITTLSVNTISRLAEAWECSLPEVLERLNLYRRPADLPESGSAPAAISAFAPAIKTMAPATAAQQEQTLAIAGADNVKDGILS